MRTVTAIVSNILLSNLLRARCNMALIAPHPRPLPTARKSLRGEGSGEAVLTSHDQQQAMERSLVPYEANPDLQCFETLTSPGGQVSSAGG